MGRAGYSEIGVSSVDSQIIKLYIFFSPENTSLRVTSRTWNPKKFGVNQDSRDLGVAVSEMEFSDEVPKDGIGF